MGDTIQFEGVFEKFGAKRGQFSMSQLKEMIDYAHDRGIRVMFDARNVQEVDNMKLGFDGVRLNFLPLGVQWEKARRTALKYNKEALVTFLPPSYESLTQEGKDRLKEECIRHKVIFVERYTPDDMGMFKAVIRNLPEAGNIWLELYIPENSNFSPTGTNKVNSLIELLQAHFKTNARFACVDCSIPFGKKDAGRLTLRASKKFADVVEFMAKSILDRASLTSRSPEEEYIRVRNFVLKLKEDGQFDNKIYTQMLGIFRNLHIQADKLNYVKKGLKSSGWKGLDAFEALLEEYDKKNDVEGLVYQVLGIMRMDEYMEEKDFKGFADINYNRLFGAVLVEKIDFAEKNSSLEKAYAWNKIYSALDRSVKENKSAEVISIQLGEYIDPVLSDLVSGGVLPAMAPDSLADIENSLMQFADKEELEELPLEENLEKMRELIPKAELSKLITGAA
jgi:hypothetical protein